MAQGRAALLSDGPRCRGGFHSPFSLLNWLHWDVLVQVLALLKPGEP